MKTIFITAISITFLQASVKLPLKLDFGPENTSPASGFIRVNPSDYYSAQKGFGFITQSQEVYSFKSRENDPQKEIYSGVCSDAEIEFKIDLPLGDYWFDLTMVGGEFTIWNGKIFINEQVVSDSLQPLQVGFEGDSPPEYWTVFRKAAVANNGARLKISVHNQPATIAALSVYPADTGPLKWFNGAVISKEHLTAPNSSLILRLINQGEINEAEKLINAIPSQLFGYEKALFLLALAGRLECDHSGTLAELAAHLLEKENNQQAGVAINARLARLFVRGIRLYNMAGWDWAKKMTRQSIFGRADLAGFAFRDIARIENHPLNPKAKFFLGKVAFWLWVEQHQPVMKDYAMHQFSDLAQYYPDNELLNIYLGKKSKKSVSLNIIANNFPPWVQLTHETMKKIASIIHYWVEKRQADNGEFGGKYDDDVEMLRWWPVTRLALEDDTALLGMRRLVDGVWSSGWIENGFSKKMRDVEHASEPVADTQPMMIGLDYGNPIYVERCMESLQGLELWTGVNQRGHRHFKSSWYSYNELDTRPPRDCDVQMNTRTVKAVRWLAWYNRHPLAMQFLREWGDAWLEDCLRTDKGKPYGIVPAAIRFEDDAIGGHADNWHHPEMFWHYYDFRGGSRMMQQFLSNYWLFGDEKYLEPIEAALQLLDRYTDVDTENAGQGSEAWVADILKNSSNFAETVEIWRLLTGRQTYDHIIKKMGSQYIKYRLTQDKNYLLEGMKSIYRVLVNNYELNTTEAYYTDRVEICDIHSNNNLGSSLLESMFTGMMLSDNFFPFYSISWQGLDNQFVALVKESTPEKLEVQVFNISDQLLEGKIRFWYLRPGKYLWKQWPLNAENLPENEPDETRHFSLLNRGNAQPVSLQAHSGQIISIVRSEDIDQPVTEKLPDLAITRADIRMDGKQSSRRLTIPVHNIGIADAKDISVTVKCTTGHSDISEQKQRIDHLEASLDLHPRIRMLDFNVDINSADDFKIEISVDPENGIPEINESNNKVVLPLEENR